MNNYEKWFAEFKNGWKVRVVENEHLLDICFLEFLSTINKVRYVYGGQYKKVNLSGFKIQQSGTGKGVGDRYVHDILRYMGYKVCKINSFTEAAIIGSLNSDVKGKTTVIPGALGEYDFIWIDEARNLIVGNSWSQGLLESINGYLDDGQVFKRLAKGNITYQSDCIFATGTFFFDKLKPTVLTTGLFQRCLFSYKNYTLTDVIRISRKYDSLSSKNYITDLEPVFHKLKDMKENLNFEKYNISNTYKNYVIKMTDEASSCFGNQIDDFFKKDIFEQVVDERLKNILASFLIRSKEIGHKIMCLYAVWNSKDMIDEECAEFAVPFIKKHLLYILDFVSSIFEGTKFDSEDLSKEDLKRKKIVKTKTMVLKAIKENPGMSKTEFRKYIQENRQLFPIGELRIIREVIPDLLMEKKIYEECGMQSAKKLLYICGN